MTPGQAEKPVCGRYVSTTDESRLPRRLLARIIYELAR